jgi:hypothetical protein
MTTLLPNVNPPCSTLKRDIGRVILIDMFLLSAEPLATHPDVEMGK